MKTDRIVELLRQGIRSDIWYDAEEYDDIEAAVLIALVQEAMTAAADKLEDK